MSDRNDMPKYPERLVVPVSKEQKQRVEKAAQQERRTMSSYVRKLVLDHIEEELSESSDGD